MKWTLALLALPACSVVEAGALPVPGALPFDKADVVEASAKPSAEARGGTFTFQEGQYDLVITGVEFDTCRLMQTEESRRYWVEHLEGRFDFDAHPWFSLNHDSLCDMEGAETFRCEFGSGLFDYELQASVADARTLEARYRVLIPRKPVSDPRCSVELVGTLTHR